MTTFPSTLGSMPVHARGDLRPGASAVVVLHQAHGITPQITDFLDLLAERGYVAVAPALHHRRGVETIDPVAEFGGDMGAFAAALPTDEDFLADLGSVLAALGEAGITDVHTVGFSYGGRASYLAAAEARVVSAVSWYAVGVERHVFQSNSGLPALSSAGVLPQVPWLGLEGERDFLLEPGELDDWQVSLGDSPAELVRYPDAGHAFDVRGAMGPDAPESFVQAAYDDALARTLGHLEAHAGQG